MYVIIGFSVLSRPNIDIHGKTRGITTTMIFFPNRLPQSLPTEYHCVMTNDSKARDFFSDQKTIPKKNRIKYTHVESWYTRQVYIYAQLTQARNSHAHDN